MGLCIGVFPMKAAELLLASKYSAFLPVPAPITGSHHIEWPIFPLPGTHRSAPSITQHPKSFLARLQVSNSIPLPVPDDP